MSEARTLYLSAQAADQREAEHEAARLDFAKRLRADGDRLASEGRWKDAIARYDQAVPYDQKGELERETQERRRAIREHGGEVKPGTDLEAQGTMP